MRSLLKNFYFPKVFVISYSLRLLLYIINIINFILFYLKENLSSFFDNKLFIILLLFIKLLYR